jgi:FdhD protein
MNGMGRLTRNRTVLKVLGGTGPDGSGRRVVRRADVLAVEEPLDVRLDGEPYLVTMRTPGDDIDLVHGLLHGEGVITAAEDVLLARYCAGTGPDGLNTYNVLDVSLVPERARPAGEPRRQVVMNSACGICGSTSIKQVVDGRRHPVTHADPVPVEHLLRAPDLLREQQRTFQRTGGLHAAGLMDATGELLCVREDVGRHNAVDKVVGWALRAGRLPLAGCALVVSSRASYELTQKAVAAGAEMLVAVSAPSSLAVELADEAGLTLVGFVRGDSLNVYCHPERIDLRPVEVPVGG